MERMERKEGSLWAAVVADTMDDATATDGRVARSADLRRGRVGSRVGGASTGLTWRASRVVRHLLPHRHVPRRIVVWHPGPGGARRMEVTSDYCRCGARLKEPSETAVA